MGGDLGHEGRALTKMGLGPFTKEPPERPRTLYHVRTQ